MFSLLQRVLAQPHLGADAHGRVHLAQRVCPQSPDSRPLLEHLEAVSIDAWLQAAS